MADADTTLSKIQNYIRQACPAPEAYIMMSSEIVAIHDLFTKDPWEAIGLLFSYRVAKGIQYERARSTPGCAKLEAVIALLEKQIDGAAELMITTGGGVHT